MLNKMDGKAYLSAVESALIPLADNQRAGAMAAYMKGHFVFLGIAAPARRAATKPIKIPDPEDVPAIVFALWARPEREYQYVALDLLERVAKKLDPAATISLIEELALMNSWWDSVDGLASIANNIFRRNINLRDTAWTWSGHANFWINRMAILHQNGWKHETDQQILFKLCLDHAGKEEFFIRKAIGWALRDYAWCNADAVHHFVRVHRDRLSNLSVREALKNVGGLMEQ
jgi:3-methyladenine DNA glycosylase AlkD